MFAYFRNGSHSVLGAMNSIAARHEPYLQSLQHVGVVIHNKNVRWIHFATYLAPETRPKSEANYYSIFRQPLRLPYGRKVVSGSLWTKYTSFRTRTDGFFHHTSPRSAL